MSKKHDEAKGKINRENQYNLKEAIDLVKGLAHTKFDETVDLAVNIGIDAKKSDQLVRGSVVLPHGLGKEVRVVVFAKGDKGKEAMDAGADFVGADDLADKISKGWFEFDRVIATPDIMGVVGKIGKLLGPRGLMPNPKTGTVTFDVGNAVKEAKAGKVEYKTEKGAIIHVPIGKVSFESEKLFDNAQSVIKSIVRSKPSTSKGKFLKKISVSSTMGAGVPVDTQTAVPA
ncbi:MAG: 50S ribosomal protein L1 [Thermodesulfovibrionia bacterium]|nr:50S ribosomal protein L1 [Thermodesulfovibrionia bacterium]